MSDHRAEVEEVRAHLVVIRGGAPFLSPADGWQLVRWLDDGVSVTAIVCAIEAAAAARRARRARTPLGLAHARKYLKIGPARGAPRVDGLSDLAARIREIDPALRALAARLAALAPADAEACARAAIAEIRSFLEGCWLALPGAERDRLLADARAAYGHWLDGLGEAVQLALVEEAARDGVRARFPGLGADLVWECLHVQPLEGA
jgi:hypothetical protein